MIRLLFLTILSVNFINSDEDHHMHQHSHSHDVYVQGEKLEVDEKKFNFLYIDGENCHFMDNSNFEQVEIPKSITGEKYKLLKENLEVTISFMEEKPISIELPNNIECIIETTDAAIKNQTASSSYKPALLDCGIKINVPPFIESGEKIIIDTRTLEYVKRVN